MYHIKQITFIVEHLKRTTMKRIFESIARLVATHKANKLHNLLKTRIVEFTFTKKDGTKRIAHGTLSAVYFADNGIESKSERTRKTNPNVVVYFDTDKNAFRSFTKASLLNVGNSVAYC